jgi:hypothetical protein
MIAWKTFLVGNCVSDGYQLNKKLGLFDKLCPLDLRCLCFFTCQVGIFSKYKSLNHTNHLLGELPLDVH